MKFTLLFLVACVLALSAAAPQFIYNGLGLNGITYPGITPLTRTVVAGPTVVNSAWGGRLLTAPGYIGTTLI